MMISYTSLKMFAGIQVPDSLLYQTETVKAYDHDYALPYVYDPISGRSLWKTVNTKTMTFSYTEYEESIDPETLVASLTYIDVSSYTREQRIRSGTLYHYVGSVYGTVLLNDRVSFYEISGDLANPEFSNILVLKEGIKSIFDSPEIDLWDSVNFGFYIIPEGVTLSETTQTL